MLTSSWETQLTQEEEEEEAAEPSCPLACMSAMRCTPVFDDPRPGFQQRSPALAAVFRPGNLIV